METGELSLGCGRFGRRRPATPSTAKDRAPDGLTSRHARREPRRPPGRVQATPLRVARHLERSSQWAGATDLGTSGPERRAAGFVRRTSGPRRHGLPGAARHTSGHDTRASSSGQSKRCSCTMTAASERPNGPSRTSRVPNPAPLRRRGSGATTRATAHRPPGKRRPPTGRSDRTRHRRAVAEPTGRLARRGDRNPAGRGRCGATPGIFTSKTSGLLYPP